MIDEHLKLLNLEVTEGYVGKNQCQMILDSVSKLKNINYVLEIGFNAGHSAAFFLQNLPSLKSFISCDICSHDYCEPLAKKLKQTFPSTFHFLKGDSKFMLQAFHESHPNLKFDLIFIDGSHNFFNVFLDILYVKNLCHENTILLIDDYAEEVKEVVDIYVMLGLLEITKNFQSEEVDQTFRQWIEAKFI